MTILTIVGARPQFIKAAAVSGRLRASHREVLLHTGQHYDDAMSDRFFRELSIPKPDIELGVGSGPHGDQTARMLVGIEAAIIETKPDTVLVYGDTNSTLAGALAASKLGVPVAHVEAGLRSYRRQMPEEINRVVTDTLSSLLFCPSEQAARNLQREGITEGVHVVGDVMAEMTALFGDRSGDAALLGRHHVTTGAYFLATVHRDYNTDDSTRLSAIMDGLGALDAPVLLPAHPRLRKALTRDGVIPAPNIRVLEPVGYDDSIALQRNASMVLTDSGGMQKEAYWLGVPCITLRDETEWVETAEAGWNIVVGADRSRIVSAARAFKRPASRPPLYGEGTAVAAIVQHLSAGVQVRST